VVSALRLLPGFLGLIPTRPAGLFVLPATMLFAADPADFSIEWVDSSSFPINKITYLHSLHRMWYSSSFGRATGNEKVWLYSGEGKLLWKMPSESDEQAEYTTGAWNDPGRPPYWVNIC
jgi:hypothetical protein